MSGWMSCLEGDQLQSFLSLLRDQSQSSPTQRAYISFSHISDLSQTSQILFCLYPHIQELLKGNYAQHEAPHTQNDIEK